MVSGITNLTSLHVSNLKASVKFYKDAFGFKELSHVKTAKYESSFIGLDTAKHPGYGKPISQRSGVVELRQDSTSVKIYNGNTEPYRGFGHLCVSVSNIVAAQKHLLAAGVTFKKRLEDGRQKDIAFVQDPDTYWIELIENKLDKKDGVYEIESNRLNHTMIRVRDPQKSLAFYQGVLGMKLFKKKDFPNAKFTLYFLGYDSDPNYVEDSDDVVYRARRESILELTHNWGTESDDKFSYYVFGKDQGIVGFDHFVVSIPDVEKFSKELGDSSSVVSKYNEDPDAKNAVVLQDPDGYKVYVQSQ